MKNVIYAMLCFSLFFCHLSRLQAETSKIQQTPDKSAQPSTLTTQRSLIKDNKDKNETIINTKKSSQKIKNFMEQENNQLSTEFPYRLNLFEKGQIAKNKAGVRISESAQQFANLGLTGLLFYYKLFDHSMRVPHWHANADEVGVVLNGKMKITIWDGIGKSKIFTVEKNGTWLIPKATLHVLENVGDSELDFLVAYNSSNAADRDFATAWAALPSDLLERSLGLSAEDIDTLKRTTSNRLSLTDPSSVPERAIIPSPFSGNFSGVNPVYTSALGSIRRIDEKTTPAMKAMAIQQTIMNPGTLREPHWYTANDTLFFVTKGSAFFTMMDNEGKVYKAIIKPGDLVFIPIGTFHSYLNIAEEPLEIYEVFNASKDLSEINLLSGAQQFSAGTLSSATGLDKSVTEKILKKAPQKYMIPF